jgi:histidine triad (HIT) family protein
MAASSKAACVFCKITEGSLAAHVVHEDETFLAFLDKTPLFPGHCLLVPRTHYDTLTDVPPDLVGPLFTCAQRLARAVERALDADGFFVAINNKVSQSVPHLHVHVVPRRKKDGLKGFFWPRHPYANDEEMARVQAAIRAAWE